MRWQMYLHLTPVALNFIGMTSTVINKFYRMIDCLVLTTIFVKIVISLPAIGNNCCSRCNPLLNKRQQSCLVSLFDSDNEAVTRVLLNSSKNPLSFQMMPSLIFLFPSLAVIYLDAFTRTTNLLTVRLHHNYFTCLTTEHVPVDSSTSPQL